MARNLDGYYDARLERWAPGRWTQPPASIIGWMTASFGLGQLLGPAVAGRITQMTQGFATPSLLAVGIVLRWDKEPA